MRQCPRRQANEVIGAVAQTAERLHGMQEVDGSTPSGSTKESKMSTIAGVAQWQSHWLPTRRRGFDSLPPLHFEEVKKKLLKIAIMESCPAPFRVVMWMA